MRRRSDPSRSVPRGAAGHPSATPAGAPPPAPTPQAETGTAATENAESAEQPAATDEAAPVAEEAAVTESGRVEISVKTGSWIQIRNAEGAVVFTKLLRPGETYEVPSPDCAMMEKMRPLFEKYMGKS